MAGVYNTRTGRFVQAGSVPKRAKRKRLSDDELLAAAVTDGRIVPARRAHYERLMAADRKGTRRLIASLTAGMRPEDSAALAANAGDGTDASGSWIPRHPRTTSGTVFDIAGRTLVAASTPPAARPPSQRTRASVSPSPPATPPRSASTQDAAPAPHDGRPQKLRPGTVLDEHGRVVASA